MNCRQFEDVVSDLARHQMMNVHLKKLAIAHSETCDSCAFRMHDELTLSAALSALMIEMDSVAAPARVEEQIMRVWSHERSETRTTASARPSRYWVAAIAATVLLAFGLPLLVWYLPTSDEKQATTRETAGLTNWSAAVAAAEQAPLTPVNARGSSRHRSQGDRSNNNRSAVLFRRPGPNQPSPAANSVGREQREIVTDFIPVTYGGAASLQDGGQVVRVELPRSALVSFGLPMNLARADERVKADVVLGVDGLARAIRFVQ